MLNFLLMVLGVVLSLSFIPEPFGKVAAGVVFLAWLASLNIKTFLAVVVLGIIAVATGVIVL